MMIERPRNDISDGVRWKCMDTTCNTSKSIRSGSFYDKSRLTLQQWMIIMFFWAEEIPVTNTARYGTVIEKTCVDMYGWFRDVCSRRLINDGPIKLGGRNVVVQIDESCFSNKPN